MLGLVFQKQLQRTYNKIKFYKIDNKNITNFRYNKQNLNLKEKIN